MHLQSLARPVGLWLLVTAATGAVALESAWHDLPDAGFPVQVLPITYLVVLTAAGAGLGLRLRWGFVAAYISAGLAALTASAWVWVPLPEALSPWARLAVRVCCSLLALAVVARCHVLQHRRAAA